MPNIKHTIELADENGIPSVLKIEAKANEDWSIELENPDATIPDITLWAIKVYVTDRLQGGTAIGSNPIGVTITDGPNGKFDILFGAETFTDQRKTAYISVWRNDGAAGLKHLFTVDTAIVEPGKPTDFAL